MNISDPSLYFFNLHALPFMMGAVIVLGLGIFVLLRNHKSLLHINYFVFTFMIFLWLGAMAPLHMSNNAALAFLWAKIMWLGVVFLSPSTYSFTITLLDLPDKRKRIFLAYLAFLPFAAAIPSNLMADGVLKFPWGYYPKAGLLEIPFLFLFLSQVIYIFLLYHRALNSPSLPPLKRKQIRLLYFALLFGYLAILDYLPSFGVPFYAWGWFTVFVFTIVVAYAVLCCELFRVTPEFAAPNIILTMPDILLVTGIDGKIAIANHAAAFTLNLTEEELLGLPLSVFVPRGEALVQQANSLSLKGLILTAGEETIIRSKEGKEIPVSLSSSVLRDRHGEPRGVAVVCHNLSKIKEYMAMVEERNQRLAALGRLVGAIGHDLRNPLGVIKNSVYLLNMKLGEGEGDEKVKKYLSIIEKETENSMRIIGDILSFARVKAPELKPESIASILEDALSRINIPENIRLLKEMPADLPPVPLDRGQIDQVFSNLILNAVQAMPKGGELRISAALKTADGGHLSREKAREWAVVAFEDTGAGIAPEVMGRIFEPLFTTKEQGTGFGLGICQNIVEAHKGKIEVESEAGRGAAFRVFFPLA